MKAGAWHVPCPAVARASHEDVPYAAGQVDEISGHAHIDQTATTYNRDRAADDHDFRAAVRKEARLLQSHVDVFGTVRTGKGGWQVAACSYFAFRTQMA